MMNIVTFLNFSYLCSNESGHGEDGVEANQGTVLEIDVIIIIIF